MSVDREELRLRLEALRRELPEGAPLVPIASVRARDRAEVRTGRVFELGLASPLFAAPELGGFVHLSDARLRLFRGPLSERSFAEAVRGPESLAVAVDEIDEPALAAALRQRERLVVLTPTSAAAGLDALGRALQLSRGVLEPELRLGTDAGPLELLATVHQLVLFGPGLEGSAPVGLLYLGGDDLAHARERARAARKLLRG